jgi:hypothetical protein
LDRQACEGSLNPVDNRKPMMLETHAFMRAHMWATRGCLSTSTLSCNAPFTRGRVMPKFDTVFRPGKRRQMENCSNATSQEREVSSQTVWRGKCVTVFCPSVRRRWNFAAANTTCGMTAQSKKGSSPGILSFAVLHRSCSITSNALEPDTVSLFEPSIIQY